MPQTRTISPFLAAMPGIDDRILRDVGLDAAGNFIEKDDPRVRPTESRRRFVEQLLNALLIVHDMMQLSAGPRAESRLLKV